MGSCWSPQTRSSAKSLADSTRVSQFSAVTTPFIWNVLYSSLKTYLNYHAFTMKAHFKCSNVNWWTEAVGTVPEGTFLHGCSSLLSTPCSGIGCITSKNTVKLSLKRFLSFGCGLQLHSDNKAWTWIKAHWLWPSPTLFTLQTKLLNYFSFSCNQWQSLVQNNNNNSNLLFQIALHLQLPLHYRLKRNNPKDKQNLPQHQISSHNKNKEGCHNKNYLNYSKDWCVH